MKSYEEMTQRVLNRAKEQKAVQKRRNRKRIIVAVTGVCCVILAVFAGFQIDRLGQTDIISGASGVSGPIVHDTPRITFLTAAGDDASQQKLVKDVVVPFHMKLRVRDIRRLSDEEVYKVWQEELDYAENYQDQTESDDYMELFQLRTAIVALIYDGKFYLVLDDYTKVKDITVTTTSAGKAGLRKVLVDTDHGPVQKATKIYWSISNETREKIMKDPTMNLSEIRDTLTFSVSFRDGTTETAVLDIMIDEEGQVLVMERGTTMTA